LGCARESGGWGTGLVESCDCAEAATVRASGSSINGRMEPSIL